MKNVLAAGRCQITTLGREMALVDPDIFVDPSRHLMPWPVRIVFRLSGTTEFLRMHLA